MIKWLFKLRVKLLKLNINCLLKDIEDTILIVEKLELTNEQWFLDFEDKLNSLSIKNHNNVDVKK